MSLADQMSQDAGESPSSAPKSLADQMETDIVQQPAASKAGLGSDFQNFMAGAGKGVVDIGRGIKQLTDIPATWLESKFPGISHWSQTALGLPSAAQSASATNADIAESRRIDAPLMETNAGLAGNLTGQLAATMIPLAGAAKVSGIAGELLNPSTYTAAAGAGALQGALQPTTENESKEQNILLGTAAGSAGNLAVNTIGRLAQPITAVMSNAQQKAVKVLENAGINLDAAQKSGSEILNRIRSSFFDNPVTAGPQAAMNAEQQSGFNRAVLRTIGIDAPAATSDVMGAAQSRINGVFKDILERNNVALTSPVINRIGDVQAAAAESEKKPVVNIANRIINAADENGDVPGQVAYGIKKDLDRLSSSSDSDLAYHARQLRSTVMDAINGSLSPEDSAAFSEARSQFARMKTIEPAIDNMGNGNISPARLANVLGQKRNIQISKYGQGDQDLVDLAQAGNLLLRDKLPNSGTAARTAMQIALPVAGALAGGSQGGTEGAGIGAGAGILLGAVAPRTAQMAMQNPTISNYLAKGITGGATPLRDLLLTPKSNAVIGGTLKRLPQVYTVGNGK